MRRIQAVGLGIVLCGVPSATVIAQGGMTIELSTMGTVDSGAPASSTSKDTAAAGTKQAPTSAPALIAAAVKAAKASNKTVLVHFGASWCSYCHKLDEFLHSKEVGPIIDAHYVLVALTVQDKEVTPGADSAMRAMKLDGGLPVFAFLDGNGKQIASSMAMPPNGENMGYPVKPEEIKAFNELVQKTAPRMTAADRTKINDYLTTVAKSLDSH